MGRRMGTAVWPTGVLPIFDDVIRPCWNVGKSIAVCCGGAVGEEVWPIWVREKHRN